MYVTVRCFRLTVAAVEKQQVLYILSLFIALVIQHAMRMRRIVICGSTGCTIFFRILAEF